MNQLQTMWSISRRKSLINCPREYVLRYSSNQTQYNKNNTKSNKKSYKIIESNLDIKKNEDLIINQLKKLIK